MNMEKHRETAVTLVDGRHPMDLSLIQLIEAIQTGKITPLDSLNACFQRIEDLNPVLNAFTYDTIPVGGKYEKIKRAALKLAKEQTEENDNKKVGLLAGVPFGVKDLEDADGFSTSYGSQVFGDENICGDKRNDTREAIEVQRLRKEGAIVVGKTNVPIFGSSIQTKNKVYGATRNPWDPTKTPGGSSGGSSAAVASSMVPFCTAADGGGSIRIPACFTGCFGLKPTRGVVPVTEFAQFQTEKLVHCVCCCPLTRNVEDCAFLLDLIAGYHPRDPFSIPKPAYSFYRSLTDPVKSCRVLFSNDLGTVSFVDPSILSEVQQACEKVMTRLGHRVVVEEFGKASVSALPDIGFEWVRGTTTEQAVAVHPFVSSKGLLDRLETGYKFSWKLIESMEVLEFSDILQKVRALNEQLEVLFDTYDVLATPTMPIFPFSATEKLPVDQFYDPMHIVGFSTPFNLSGHPAVNVRIPVPTNQKTGVTFTGLQLVGRRHEDLKLLQLAKQFQDETKCFASYPSVKTILSHGSQKAFL